jgi:hypothetical protein
MRQQTGQSIQGGGAWADGVKVTEPGHAERRRTIVALVSASLISVVVWGLIVALHIQ